MVCAAASQGSAPYTFEMGRGFRSEPPPWFALRRKDCPLDLDYEIRGEFWKAVRAPSMLTHALDDLLGGSRPEPPLTGESHRSTLKPYLGHLPVPAPLPATLHLSCRTPR